MELQCMPCPHIANAHYGHCQCVGIAVISVCCQCVGIAVISVLYCPLAMFCCPEQSEVCLNAMDMRGTSLAIYNACCFMIVHVWLWGHATVRSRYDSACVAVGPCHSEVPLVWGRGIYWAICLQIQGSSCSWDVCASYYFVLFTYLNLFICQDRIAVLVYAIFFTS